MAARTKPPRKKRKKAPSIPLIWRQLAGQLPFSQLFFLEQLPDFVHERSPRPEAGVPLVHMHLADGEVLNLSHVIGLGDFFGAFAVYEGSDAATDKLRTELVPFELIMRISVRAPESAEPQIGFRIGERPRPMPPQG